MKKTREKMAKRKNGYKMKVENLQKNKKEQGITLIALVVTIVVLLILAGITINMLFSDGGIFKTVSDAVNAWNEATVNEQESLNSLVEQIRNLVNETGESIDTPGENPDILERYILGEDKKGVLLTDIMDMETEKFKDNEIIKDASTSLTFLGADAIGNVIGNKYYLTIQYNNESYIVIANVSTYITEKLIKIPKEATSGIEKWNGTTNNKVSAVQSKDATPVNVPVPKGFTASTVEEEQTVEGGFVIKQDGTNNEFVWIPVSEERLSQMYIKLTCELSGETGVITNIYSKNSYYGVPGGISYREPDLVTKMDTDSQYYSLINRAGSVEEFAQDMVNEYREIHDSIEKYGGFYIGRYEVTGDINSPTVVKGGTVITSQDWYNLKAACMKIVNNTDKQESEITAKTTMIYGNQWDEVCNWLSGKGYDINNSTSWGNYSDNTEEGHGTKQIAGYSENWKANNIYDFAGNCEERTQEANSDMNRVNRGGDCNSSGSEVPASNRRPIASKGVQTDYISTRATLYVM